MIAISTCRLLRVMILQLTCVASLPVLAQPAANESAPRAAGQVLVRTNEVLTPSQQTIVDKLKAAPEASNVRVRKILGVVADLLTHNDMKLIMPISGGRDVTLVRTQPSTSSSRGAITWRGETEETGERAVLMLWEDGRLSGYFGYDGTIFTIKSLGSDLHVVAELDRGKLPPTHAPVIGDAAPVLSTARAPQEVSATPSPPEPAVAPFTDAERIALEAKKITIDVMILYTKKADEHYIGDLSDLLPSAIEETNATFRNSGIGNISIQLVHTQAVDYDEAGADHFDHLYRMVDGVGPFKELRKLRNEKQADIVGLILDSPSGCGLATRVGSELRRSVLHRPPCLREHHIVHCA